jgi:hypothetical protein
MIQFEYGKQTRLALEIGADDRMIGCMFCFQVMKNGEPSVGHRSFKIHKMIDVVEIDREPFAEALQDIDETGFMGDRGGGYGPCQGIREDKGGETCGLFDDLNFDQRCPGCETAVVLLQE